MLVVIFRARARQLDAAYSELAAELRETALRDFGCVAFHSVGEDGEEIALSYWPDEASIRAWKAHNRHLLAQDRGREHWYESYTVQVAQITREYSHPDDTLPGPGEEVEG